MLPPSLEEITAPICILFVGSQAPTQDWLRNHAKPLAVNGRHVRTALAWLKANNPYYRDIELNEPVLRYLDANPVLPFSVQHIPLSTSAETLTDRYKPPERSSRLRHLEEPLPRPEDVPWESVVITDVNMDVSSNKLKAAALKHVKTNRGGYIEVCHDPIPINKFNNPALFPLMYPTLFPYGVGGLEDRGRLSPLAFDSHVKHLLQLNDRRFQKHRTFLFTVFNMIQRRKLLLQTSFRVKRKDFPEAANRFATVSAAAVAVVADRVSNGDFLTANSPEEHRVLTLMKEVNAVASAIPGSSMACLAKRNEVKALMMDKGLASFYITINPADIYNPVVKFLGGSDIDVDDMLPSDILQYWDQSVLVAKNPVVAATFFNAYMKAFIRTILGYDPKQENLDGSVLGLVNAYYGCVEAQGRGTLHCHMMVWVDGSLNPDQIKQRIMQDNDVEFRDRLLMFLDDAISNCIPPGGNEDIVSVPSDASHACAVHGIQNGIPEHLIQQARDQDFRNLVKDCQIHSHSNTCFKYCDKYERICRFDLDESNYIETSSFDYEKGELCLRCLNGLVNNFNDTIIRAMQCNMNIKFIGSGASAKAILYYITDYITKSQLKLHVAYAALELSIQKLGEYNPNEDDVSVRAKRLLQHCSYAMISHQELSAQQVVLYLLEYEDHFTSHNFSPLYWTAFESFIEEEQPSPECCPSAQASEHRGDPEDESPPFIDDILLGHAEPDQSEVPLAVHPEPRLDMDEEHSNDSDDEDNVSTDGEEEIVVSIDHSSGRLVPRSSRVCDYQLRGNFLRDMNLWEYFARVKKVKTVHKKTNKDNTDDDIDIEGDDNDFWGVNGDEFLLSVEEDGPANSGHSNTDTDTTSAAILDSLDGTDWNTLAAVLEDTHRNRPKAHFDECHPDSKSHHQVISLPIDRRIPVPSGVNIPR